MYLLCVTPCIYYVLRRVFIMCDAVYLLCNAVYLLCVTPCICYVWRRVFIMCDAVYLLRVTPCIYYVWRRVFSQRFEEPAVSIFKVNYSKFL